MSEWDTAEFGSLYLVPSKNGLMAPSRVRGTGALLVNMKEIFSFDVISQQTMERAPLPARNPESWLLRNGDLLFARQSLTLAGAGKVSVVRDPAEAMTFESHIIRVRLDPQMADSRFYYYLFRSPRGRELVSAIVEQVAAAGIRASDLGRLEVPLPTLDEQRRIAGVLGALDDLIDTNYKLARTLEDQMLALFAVENFDAPPSRQAITLGDVVSVNPRLAKPSSEAAYVDMAALPTDSSRIASVARRAPTGGSRFQNSDTLLARLTPCLENGKAAFVDVLEGDEVAIGSTEFLVLRDRGRVGCHWPYMLTRSQRFRDYAIVNMNGSSGRQRVSAETIANYPMAQPNLDALDRFRSAAATSFAAIRAISEEIADLKRTREELLHYLMSGKARVSGSLAVA